MKTLRVTHNDTGPEPYPVVLVQWVDSASPRSGWGALSSHIYHGVTMCTSVGFLVHESETDITIASSVARCEIDEEDPAVNDSMSIPLIAIVSRTVLLEAPKVALAL